MNLEKKAYLTCDTAYEHGIVTLFDEHGILYEKVLLKKMSHGGEICQAIDDAVNMASNEGYLLSGVFSGLGPGSFVGVRISLATLLGFSFAQSLPLMGFCSHLALAYSQVPKNDNFFIYMKASGDLGYLTGFLLKNNKIIETIASSVVDINEVLAKTGPGALVYSDHAEKLLLKTNNRLETENLLGQMQSAL